ncbi:MAG: SurA N-terminal domain-containing protein, partial [Proteobacteria bacterium]|nr:SurA N-terminal domain-containing protein [Pseudomonadota bacterium]
MLGLKLFAAALALVAIVLIPPAVGQEVQSIAAVVNDEVISIYDLDQRVRLLIKTARIEDTAASRQRVRQRVLRGLIDEKLQLQEAARYNTSVTDADLERGVRLVERQNNMKPGDLERFFKANQVSFDVFVDRLRAEIAWTKLIARRLRPTLRIGEDEIDEAEKQVNEDKDKPAFLISEIFFPVDSADDDVEIRTTAERVVGDIKGGARFAEMARQYSSGVTAFEGGNVGWV